MQQALIVIGRHIARLNQINREFDRRWTQFEKKVASRKLGFGTIVSGGSLVVAWLLQNVLVGLISADASVWVNVAVQITAFSFMVDVLLKLTPSWSHTVVYAYVCTEFAFHALYIVENRCNEAMEHLTFLAGQVPTCAIPAPIAI